MLTTKTPLRVSFLGGGTDFPWFFEQHTGAVIATTINKYIYISALSSFDEQTTYLKYSRLETVTSFSKILHPIFRTILMDRNLPPMDWSVMADIPAGNGLASSSAFTVGLVKAADSIVGTSRTPGQLALEAVRVELDLMSEPIGIQDQFASAIGGMNIFTFESNRRVFFEGLLRPGATFPFSLILVKVGALNRNASEFTKAQREFATANKNVIRDLIRLRDLTLEAARELSKDMSQIAKYTRAGWDLKVKTNPGATSSEIMETMAFAMKNGAEAGKLVGAGGSGFLLLLADPEKADSLVSILRLRGHKALEVALEPSGSNLVKHD